MTTLASKEELIGRRDPNHTVTVEPCAKWVRVMHNGEFIADSRRALLLFETRNVPAYYFPREDVRMDLMSHTELVTQCPYKGNAEYYSLSVGDSTVENVVWAYTSPFEDTCPDISGYVAFYWNKVDHWFEEDEEVFVHARDPHKRVDCLPSTRHVRVEQGGVTLAESVRPTLLFETGLPVRYYLPVTDVRMDLLTPDREDSRAARTRARRITTRRRAWRTARTWRGSTASPRPSRSRSPTWCASSTSASTCTWTVSCRSARRRGGRGGRGEESEFAQLVSEWSNVPRHSRAPRAQHEGCLAVDVAT